MPIVLYKVDGSPPARAVLMVLEQIGLKVDTKELMPLKGEQFNPEFLAKNPVHTIPFIEDGDFKLADSHAIITYLVSKYGAEKKSTLYPSDLELRATIDQRMYMDASLVFPKLRAIIMTVVKDKAPGPTEEQVTAVKEVYGYLEKYLGKTKFLAADHLTLADVSLVASISSLDGVVPIEGFPRVTEWLNLIKEFDWYKKANEPGLNQLVGLLKTTMEKNSA